MYLGSHLDVILLNKANWGGQLFAASQLSVINAQPVSCSLLSVQYMPRVTNDSPLFSSSGSMQTICNMYEICMCSYICTVNILCMLVLIKELCVCFCYIIISWRIRMTGPITDLTYTWLVEQARRASRTFCIRLCVLYHQVALNRVDRGRRTRDLRLGPWILIGSFDLTSVWEHCWHTQSFPLNVTLSPIGKGLLWSREKDIEVEN